MSGKITDKKSVRDFLVILEAKGVRDVIITPGSRNAPFSISFFKHPSFQTLSITDERSAAFFALGMAQQTGRPVVLICTSGTAALNFSPAIAEAFYQRIPLLVVTADRPLEWVDQGEGQTIRQSKVFSNYVKGSFDIVQEAAHKDLIWHNQRIINEAVDLATKTTLGPVHINFPLRESLYKTIDRQKEDTKIIYGLSTDNKLEEKHWQELLKSIDRAKKILVLCGQLPPDFLLNDSLVQLCNDPRICVLTESHSNLVHDYFIGTIDRLIIGFDEEQIAFFRPDILITLGNNIISRKIKAYLREGNAEHWHIDAAAEPLDTFQRLKKIVPLSPRQFIVEWVQRHKPQSGNYATLLSAMHLQNRNSATSFIESTRFCDLSAMATIVSFLPDGSCLQMANSAVVRYIQLFDPRADIRYFANRGVSGIDGCTSTAAGAAYASGQLTTLITGDIAFFYDSNAFWNNYISDHLKIIVLNNAGGGIFRIIEGPSSSEAMEEFFETHHNRTAEALAAMYGIPYLSAADSNELSKGLSALYHSKGCMVLEVHTPRLENDKVLKDCFKMIKNNQLQLRNESLQLDKH